MIAANHLLSEILEKMCQGFLEMLEQDGSLSDPVTKIKDARPIAEVGKGFAILGKKEAAERCFQWLVKNQGENGSWHEIMDTGYDEENTLSSAVIGKCFLDAYKKIPKKEYLSAAERAWEYVLSKEFSPGFFIKAYGHYSDLLNVNAACAAFGSSFAIIKKSADAASMVERAVLNVVRYQFKDGAFPYERWERAFPYEDHLNVRDVYYHALTCYYLWLADPGLKNRHFAIAALKALRWLSSMFAGGVPRWRKSKVIFAVGAEGLYGYAAYCFLVNKKNDLLNQCLLQLKRLQKQNGLFSRYEPPRFFDSLLGIMNECYDLTFIAPTGYSLSTRMVRIRRRLAHELKTRTKGKVSLFYSAQIFNALTECLQ